MKNLWTILIAGLVGLVLILYMITDQVPFDKVAVVTTFGKASRIINAQPDVDEGGLIWKWPSPVQAVHEFDKRVQTLDVMLEEQQTADSKAIIPSAYMTWRITDPLAFYKSLRNEQQAVRILRDRLRGEKTVLANYSMSQLVSSDPQELKLDEAEQRIRRIIADSVAQQGYGVEIVSVGIKRLLLPAPVTEKVFETMKSTRQKLAQNARSEGQSIADVIRNDAEQASRTILSFADRRAQTIMAEGDAAAAEYYPLYSRNSELAIFLRTLEAYEKIFKEGSTTYILDAKEGVFNQFIERIRSAADPATTPDTPTAP